MALVNTAAFPKQLDLSIHKMFSNEFREADVEFSKVAKIEPAPKGAEIREAEISGLGAMQTKPEGTQINFVSPTEGHEKAREYTTYGLGFQTTEEMLEDEVFGKIKAMSKELGKSAAYKRETVFWDLFNSGFATHQAWDGQYIFVASGRTLLAASGTSQNNRPGSDGALSETTYEAAMQYFYKLKQANGRPMIMTPYLLVIPPELIGVANVLMRTPDKVGSMNNDLSRVPFYPNSPMKIHVSRHLTSTTAWFILAKEHDMRFVWKRNIKLQSSDDFGTGNRLYKATMRFVCFCNKPFGGYGTTGA